MFAEIALAKGEPARAARLLGAWDQHSGGKGWKQPAMFPRSAERGLKAARRELGPTFDRLYTEGRLLSLDGALQEAIRPAAHEQRGLTPRELDILGGVAAGLSNQRIADAAGVSIRTVHAHLRALFAKLGVTSRSAAVRVAVEEGIITLTRPV
jgi:DNA-binding CsgD family transcriptional regulator